MDFPGTLAKLLENTFNINSRARCLLVPVIPALGLSIKCFWVDKIYSFVIIVSNMSILKIKNITNIQKVIAFLFLALLFVCSQVYQFSHLHHFHNDGSLAFEVSYHPLDVAVEHSSAHHHNKEKSSHKNDSQHENENIEDWNLRRAQSTKNLTFDVQSFFFSNYSLPPVGIKKTNSFFQNPSLTKEHYISCSAIRGPPLFG